MKTDQAASPDPAPPGGVPPARRPWSARRIPAALTALVVAAATGALLFDVVRVRAGGNAAAWRTSLAPELATRPLDDVWMRVGAAVLALLGLWLIVLALTPGLRHQYPLKSPDAHVRAVLDRDAAVLLLRDAALRVPGVSGARIRMRRHRVAARADVRFRSPAEVRADLEAVLREQIDRLALADPPGLAVRTRARPK
ncbi:hypothetical protein ADK53_27775 [Streptomyces sp. WM6373]|uniref:DUF6286 domain-containing protein n=1 Tax=Streptomyces TaxID=1883 RepID=UPI0006B01863|nr:MULTISPECIES: DUF6286 domain-containing protein [unclassified Streptomyces]KOU30805.1 hypothetical protein ADK53_27775 [Streptomyces sp. WM6373]KOU69620.1 hypothetical protein ADK61_36855 [Streptomyces sp. XY66]KOU70422.1 hypothetical protein ADK96_07850 [Streptomyces sp. IGB124]KOU93808.1 hypothetical protein ADK93_05975 [Streptomyces sp. XY58]KOV07985.1 hypothetical protein ADK89_08745 [Streptomyces sp. XY37]